MVMKRMVMILLVVVVAAAATAEGTNEARNEPPKLRADDLAAIIEEWAPLIWLHPEEVFFPSSVDFHFENVEFPQTEEEWKSVAGQFEQDWQFPHCLGALDGKHVDIIPPADSGSLFYNYKGRHSLVLMAIANAKCEFIMCDFGSNGRNSDGGVIQNTLFYRKLTNKSLNIPAEGQLDKSHRVLPYVFVCDDAFALRPDMMKPYRMGDLTGHNERKIFNYRLSRARRVIESAFGIMASRFRIFHTRINLSLDNIDAVVMACCVLHNYLLKSSLSYASADCFDVENINCGTTVQGLRAEESNMMNIARRNQGNPMEAAKIIRENFADYFISEGKLPWQDNFIE